MNVTAQYIESSSSLMKAGVILKGCTRNSRQPVHMMLLCDTSGSMEQENKLNSVKRSVHLLLSLLSPDDRISLVTFSDTSKIILSCVTPTPEDRQAIQYRIDSLQTEGSTNMSAGILEIRNLVENDSSGRKQGVILLTDGHANIGVTVDTALNDIAKRVLSEFPGLTFTTVAYGVDHNSQLLTDLAATGGGAYNLVKNLEDVATVFGDILGGLMSVSAQGVEIQLPPDAEAVTSYRCEKVAGVTTIYVGDLYADAEIVILFKNHPSKGPIRVKGTDMTTLDRIDQVIEPSPFTTVPKSIRITELRQKAADILKKVSKGENKSSRKEIDALLNEIRNDTIIEDHPLRAMLLEDLEEAKTAIASNNHLDAQTTIEMAQHSAFLATSRGLRAATRNVDPSLHITRSVGFTSPFANNVQTQVATVMRTLSQQPENSQIVEE